MWRVMKSMMGVIANACLGEARDPDEIKLRVGVPVDIWGHWHAGASGTPTRNLLMNVFNQIANDEEKAKKGKDFLWKGREKKIENDRANRERIHWIQETVPGELYRRCNNILKDEEQVRYPTAGQMVAAAVLQSDEWNRADGPSDEIFESGFLEGGITSREWVGTATPLRFGPREIRYARVLAMAAVFTGMGTMIMAVVQIVGLISGQSCV